LSPGRLIKIRNLGWGAVVNFSKKTIEMVTKTPKDRAILNLFQNENKKNLNSLDEVENSEDKNVEILFVNVILNCKNNLNSAAKIIPGNLKEKDGLFGVVPCVMISVENISPYKIKIPQDLTDKSALKNFEQFMNKMMNRFKGKIPEIDPNNQMNIKDINLKEKIEIKNNLEKIICGLESKIADFDNEEKKSKRLEFVKEKDKLVSNINQLCDKLSKSKDLV